MDIIELPSASIRQTLSRISQHNHVKGLGLDAKCQVTDDLCGITGQEKARRALGLYLKMIENGTNSGGATLIAGPPGTGKTALAIALAKSLPDASTPFVHISGSEVFSKNVSKIESLTQALRRAIAILIKDEVTVAEGEVVEIEVDRPAEGGSGSKCGSITLRTSDMETLYDLGPKLIAELQKKNITAGDVVSIEMGTGRIDKLGRSFTRSSEFDAQINPAQYIPCPKGEVKRMKETVHNCTLHDIDIVNSRTQGFFALFSGDTGEVSSEIRNAVDQRIRDLSSDDRAKSIPGVLFIDECHMLDMECFSYLNRATESELSPILIFATNRGLEKIRGRETVSAHAIPMDFLDRMLIIHTEPYSDKELRTIIRYRAQEENVIDFLEDGALALLVEAARHGSLRYALNLINISNLIRDRRLSFNKNDAINDPNITIEDVKKASNLFVDAKTSADTIDSMGHLYLDHIQQSGTIDS